MRRNPQDHVGFGHGIHSCVGAPLARVEAQAVLTALVNQVTTLACGDPVRVPTTPPGAWPASPWRLS